MLVCRRPYRHGDEEVGSALFKAAYLGDQDRSNVGYDGLYNEDDGNDCKVGQLVGGQLRREFGKDKAGRKQLRVEIRQD
jgi:hypothetical protein